jgi:HAMP domain-containing protein
LVGASVTVFGAGLGLLLALSIVEPISKIVQSTNAILKEAQRPEHEREKEEMGTAAPLKVVDEVKTYLNRKRFWVAPPTDEVKVLLNALEKLARALSVETELKEKTMVLEEDTKKRTAELLSTTKKLELESEERRVMEAILYNIIPCKKFY